MTCRICGGHIPQDRLGRWSWVVTCSRDCADNNALLSNRRARAAYKRRRQDAAKGVKPT